MENYEITAVYQSSGGRTIKKKCRKYTKLGTMDGSIDYYLHGVWCRDKYYEVMYEHLGTVCFRNKDSKEEYIIGESQPDVVLCFYLRQMHREEFIKDIAKI